MIQDIGPYRYHGEYQPRSPRATDRVICCRSTSLLTVEHDGIADLPRYDEIAPLAAEDAHTAEDALDGKCRGCPSDAQAFADEPSLRYLFSVDRTAFFYDAVADEAVADATADPRRPTMSYRDRSTLRELPDWLAFAGATGMHLARWYADNRYCGRCGEPLVHSHDARELTCPHCGNTVYPKISPVVIVGVTCGDRLLLTRYAHGAYRLHALVAGFVEIGETLEDAVRREVMEEVGLSVSDIRYYRSQPWGFSDSLLSGFFCEAVGDGQVHLNTDGLDELSEAVWFTRDEMEPNDDPLSLTAEMMELFRTGRHDPA